MSELKIGMVGLDTSHCGAFAKLLNTQDGEYSVPGGKVTVGFAGGSPDFANSINRVEKFTEDLKNNFGVEIVDSPRAVAEKCDAVILTSVDGRVHRAQFEEIAPTGKPVFIDKPFATSSADAKAIVETAKQHGVRLMSSSSLRYGQPLVDALSEGNAPIYGGDCSGPMKIEETQGGLFWYGIHTVEMLFAIMGQGCEKVTTTTNDDHDFVVGVWKDGRIGTVRGNRIGNGRYACVIHRENGTQLVDVSDHPKPLYAGLLERVMKLFKDGEADVPLEETLEIMRFIEAANESRDSGKTVTL